MPSDTATLAAVLPADAGGEKRTRVLRVLAAFADEDREPSLREIAERAEIAGGWQKAEVLIRRLEADGLVRVQWVRARRHRRAGECQPPRNRYELLLP